VYSYRIRTFYPRSLKVEKACQLSSLRLYADLLNAQRPEILNA
ncbi:hypothetical protein THOM_2085, partial [Trachipleistophora hominis]